MILLFALLLLKKVHQSLKEVQQGANKVEVKKAVEEIFKVNVVSVNIVNVRRKARRVGRYEGFRPAVKKAVVTVAEGQTIDAFEI